MSEDRKFAYECAKHVLRQVQADHDSSSANVARWEEQVKKAAQSLKEAERAYAVAMQAHVRCTESLSKAKSTVDALAPQCPIPEPPK